MPEAIVSVVVPAYNRACRIAKTTDSALAPNQTNLEIVDDGATDDTAALIARAYAHEPRGMLALCLLHRAVRLQMRRSDRTAKARLRRSADEEHA